MSSPILLDGGSATGPDRRTRRPSAHHATADASRWWGIKTAVVVTDAAALVVALVGAWIVVAALQGRTGSPVAPADLVLGVVCVPLWLAGLARCGLYRLRFVTSRLEEFRRIVRGAAVGAIVMACAGFALHLDASRSWLVAAAFAAVATLTSGRAVIRRHLERRRRRGELLRPVIIVGGNVEAVALADMLMSEPGHGYEVVGFLCDEEPADALLTEVPVLGHVRDVLDAVAATGATGVIVATTAVDLVTSNKLARQLADEGVHVELSSSLRDIAARRLTVRPVGRHPLVYVEPVQRQGWRGAAKRAFDLAVAGAVLVIAAPLMVLTAVLVKLGSPGPVLFRQERVGLGGEPFTIFKLRDDPRVTRVGRVLRKLSVDELPQLWNVVRGEMSLVGPRPALPSEVAEWHADVHGRLRVKPGITGAWQVSGRSNASFEDYTRLDLYYVDNWSLASDVAIVLKTIPTVLFGRGAY